MEPFKRKLLPTGEEDPAANYYVRFMVRGKPYLWCTKTPDKALARRRAREYREAVTAEQFHLVDKMKSRSTCPTFNDLFKQYLELPLSIEKPTMLKNIAGMRFVIRAAGINGGDRIDLLGADTVLAFQKAGLAAGIPPSTLNSRFRSAKSLFSSRALIGYKPQISTAIVVDFTRVPALKEPERLIELPSDAAMALAHQQLPANDINVYRCFLLACYAGLRAGEIEAARWDWIEGDVMTVGGRVDFHTKSRKWRPIRLHADVLAKLNEGPRTDPEYIAGPTPTRTAKRYMAPALRALGINLRNPTHAARRWAGSQVAATSGLHAAQHMLGHSSPVVTSKHYARVLNVPAPVPMAMPAPVAAVS